jgi:hypothetical protein
LSRGRDEESSLREEAPLSDTLSDDIREISGAVIFSGKMVAKTLFRSVADALISDCRFTMVVVAPFVLLPMLTTRVGEIIPDESLKRVKREESRACVATTEVVDTRDVVSACDPLNTVVRYVYVVKYVSGTIGSEDLMIGTAETGPSF